MRALVLERLYQFIAVRQLVYKGSSACPYNTCYNSHSDSILELF